MSHHLPERQIKRHKGITIDSNMASSQDNKLQSPTSSPPQQQQLILPPSSGGANNLATTGLGHRPTSTEHLPLPGSRAVTPTDLLAWGIAHQERVAAEQQENLPTTAQPNQHPHEPIDPKWIDIILGKPDAVRMRECMDQIESLQTDVVDKITAFDELELLVESLDNANDLRVLGLWTRIYKVLESSHAELREYACWVLGTAVQNNLKAQQDFLHTGGLSKVLGILQNDSEVKVKAKSIYCISGVIRTFPDAFMAFKDLNGFPVILTSLKDGDLLLIRRVLFFLGALIAEEEGEVSPMALSLLREYDFPSTLLSLLETCKDEDVLEKAIDLLLGIGHANPSFLAPMERDAFIRVAETILSSPSSDQDSLDGVDAEKVKELISTLRK